MPRREPHSTLDDMEVETKESAMSTITEDGTKPVGIEAELQELQRDEHELEERTDRLSLAGGLTMIFSILALIVGVTALTIALIANGKSGSKTTARVASPAAAAQSKATAPAVASGKVDVKVGQMF